MVASSSSSDSSADFIHEATLYYDQIYLVVQRSMCLQHFSEFDSLHLNLRNVCETILFAPAVVRNQLSDIFPHPLEKVRREDWIRFDNWLREGFGRSLQNLYFDWSFYGRYTIRTCDACRARSSTLGWDEEENVGVGNVEVNHGLMIEEAIVISDDDEPVAVDPNEAGAEEPAGVPDGVAPGVEEPAEKHIDDGPPESESDDSSWRKAKKPKL